MNGQRDPFVRYVTRIRTMMLNFESGTTLDVTSTLKSGRANYVLFQHLVAGFSGLSAGTEGGSSDLVDERSRGYEVKAYRDPDVWPQRTYDKIHTSASSTFGPNNQGPVIGRLLKAGDYAGALAICRASGYDKNDFYVYTNTQAFTASTDFSYLIIPRDDVVSLLSPLDPRLISRAALLARAQDTVTLA